MLTKRRIKPRFWLITLATVMVLFSFVYISQALFLENQAARLEELRASRQAILNENEELSRKIAFTKTDEYVRRMARKELGLVEDGEIRFVASGK